MSDTKEKRNEKNSKIFNSKDINNFSIQVNNVTDLICVFKVIVSISVL